MLIRGGKAAIDALRFAQRILRFCWDSLRFIPALGIQAAVSGLSERRGGFSQDVGVRCAHPNLLPATLLARAQARTPKLSGSKPWCTRVPADRSAAPQPTATGIHCAVPEAA